MEKVLIITILFIFLSIGSVIAFPTYIDDLTQRDINDLRATVNILANKYRFNIGERTLLRVYFNLMQFDIDQLKGIK
jgi:capsule polysaccharide export protein KpsC/LpsZ